MVTRRIIKRFMAGLVVLLVVVAAGRLVQVALQSRLQGARGPYLQMPAPDAVTLRWQTLEAVPGIVHYGRDPARLEHLSEGESGRIHEVRLTGLTPDSDYFYRIDGEVHPFHTAPPRGAERPLRLWVQGDPGHAYPVTLKGRDAVLAWAQAHSRAGLPPLDLWLTTGDNAYRSGKDEEFQKNLFDAYPKLLPSLPYIPVYGNHDARRRAFYKLFTFPQQGELGGVPSGSEHYFSLDYGQLHLVVLDSEESLLWSGAAMREWLARDLEANRLRWTVVLLHHPPYTRGSHDSDSRWGDWGRLTAVREELLPMLEAHDVDLVLAGHSHVYERSKLLRCHYGTSETLTPAMVLEHGNHFTKPLAHSGHSGTLYAVVGSSSSADKGPLDHPAMAFSARLNGSLLIDIEGERLTGRFITPEGKVADEFVLEKRADVAPPAPLCSE